MLAAIVTATAVSLCPSTHDTLAAFADLAAESGSPPLTDRSPRARVAHLAALHAAGGLDDGAPDFRWFAASLPWSSEIDLARRLVAQVRECPADDWLPPPSWFAAEAAAYGACAESWRRRACEYRTRQEWEADRAEELAAWASHFERAAEAYQCEACRFAAWAGASWQRPRRVVLAEVRAWIGEAAWEARQWPD